MIIDILLVAIFALVTWSVASEGAWGAGLISIATILSGLLAMNFFEPLARWLEMNISASPAWGVRWDVIALVGLFALFVLLFRTGSDYLLPSYMNVHSLVHDAGRWSCAALTGYVTIAFLLTALHTAPLPRNFIGFRAERKNLFGAVAPDRQWLGFTQYVTEKAFLKGNGERIFDGHVESITGQTNTTWPSFPIRYAARRDLIAAGGATAAPTTRGPGMRRRGSSGTKSKGRTKF